MKILFSLSCIIFPIFCSSLKAQNLYFPPLSSSENWDTISPESLNWCLPEIDTLYHYLEDQDTKGFIVLKDGKIVLEKYFGTFTKDSIWYWASAGKTLTSFLVGKAQEENFLSITEPTANYLGAGWTNCTPAQEDKIKIRNQLTMSSGLDDQGFDNHCTIDTCLNYLADAGTRWAYHNAPYTLLSNVLDSASGMPINLYTHTRLKAKIGMSGAWNSNDFDNVYYSPARSMARFGLLIQNKGVWNTDTLLSDTAYFNQMISTSQNLNLSYGYLWWLNGKASFMLPSTQNIFPGSYAPAAPADMIAALGKNGQILSISNSKGLVIVRMGMQADGAAVSTQLCNGIWERLNAVMCNTSSINDEEMKPKNIQVFPNPAQKEININMPSSEILQIEISNSIGQTLIKTKAENRIDVSGLAKGLYILSVKHRQATQWIKFMKQ